MEKKLIIEFGVSFHFVIIIKKAFILNNLPSEIKNIFFILFQHQIFEINELN